MSLKKTVAGVPKTAAALSRVSLCPGFWAGAMENEAGEASSADYYFESYNHYGVHEARATRLSLRPTWNHHDLSSERSRDALAGHPAGWRHPPGVSASHLAEPETWIGGRKGAPTSFFACRFFFFFGGGQLKVSFFFFFFLGGGAIQSEFLYFSFWGWAIQSEFVLK